MVSACSWRSSNDVNEFRQPHNTMCGDVITLVSMMYIITYIISILGIHSFVHSHVVTIIIHVHSNKVTISHVHSNRVAIIHVHSNCHMCIVTGLQ